MSFRGAFCLILDKYKGGKISRDDAVVFLEDYFVKHLPPRPSTAPTLEEELNAVGFPDPETIRVADDWLVKGRYNE